MGSGDLRLPSGQAMKACPHCSAQSPPEARFCKGCGRAFGATCPRCGRQQAADSRFCAWCGQSLGALPLSCPGCAKANPAGARFCAFCGTSLGAPAPGLSCPQCRAPNPPGSPICSACRAVFDLPRQFVLRPNEYEYAGDREALNALRSVRHINMVTAYVAKKLGKPFIEGQFIGSGIRVSPEQFPHVMRLAAQAARVLGVPRLPHIYISGDKGWLSDTYGTATDSFVVLGSFLVRSLSEAELLFVLAHELGHVRSGHAMYRTVAHILAGSQAGAGNVMSQGLLGMLDINKLIVLPLELPLMAWLRQSEVTGDRAGLAVVGDVAVARKVLILMALRSYDMYEHINLEAYLKQQEEMDRQIVKLSEFVSQGTPYVARRIRLVEDYARSAEFQHLRARMLASPEVAPVLAAIAALKEARRPAAASPAGARPGPGRPAPAGASPGETEVLRGRCPHCQAGYSVPRERLPATGKVHLRCSQCKKTFPLVTQSQRKGDDADDG